MEIGMSQPNMQPIELISAPQTPLLVVEINNDFVYKFADRREALIEDFSEESIHFTVPRKIVFAHQAPVHALRERLAVPCISAFLFGIVAEVVGCGAIDRPGSKKCSAIFRFTPISDPHDIIIRDAYRPGAVRILDIGDWRPRTA